MTTRDKVGIVVLIVLFAVLILGTLWTVRPYSDTSHSPEDSVFVRQRMRNLEKSK